MMDRHFRHLTRGSVVNLAGKALTTSERVAIERNLLPEALSAVAEETREPRARKDPTSSR